MLIGSKSQIDAQMEYIYRGNYGLTTAEEMIETGIEPAYAEELMRMKLKFAFGTIHKSDELLDHKVVSDTPTEVRSGVMVKRLQTNVFEFSYGEESVTVDINMAYGQKYRSPYPLGFQNVPREYFAVVHSGQGDGWDTNRPSMASILIYQGKVYLIDAGPNIAYSLTALGIGVNEIEGIFHTHCHDDHFAGLTSLIRADHKIKYFATPLVKSSVFKKLAALLSIDEEQAESYFEVHDLRLNEWTDIDGLEVRALMSPHPVETTALTFRTFWEGRHLSYSHLADIASLKVLNGMITDSDDKIGISKSMFDQVKEEYLRPVELKKIDIGGGLIHGAAEDFEEDSSGRIILAHQSENLTSKQKEIGSSAPFGVVDTLIADKSDNLRRFAFEFLRAYFSDMDRHNLRTILNCPIVEFMPGSIILKKGSINENIFLVLTGNVDKISSSEGFYNELTAGGLIGEHSGINKYRSRYTYRAISFVFALHIPASLYLEIISRNKLHERIERLQDSREFIEKTWLFGESISPSVQNRIAESMTLQSLPAGSDITADIKQDCVYLIKSGTVDRFIKGSPRDTLSEGDFYGMGQSLFKADCNRTFHTQEAVDVYEIPGEAIKDIPVVMWKLLESWERRTN